MRPLGDMNIIQIEVTNACYLKCANCTRHVGHHKKTFFMDLVLHLYLYFSGLNILDEIVEFICLLH